MLDTHKSKETIDLFVIGGGINGCGIARDAAGRGLSVTLVEMNDLGSATSSASTKLFHGGLRYLEYFEFGLVAKALKERETLLRAMPHISWPLRFVLPYHKDMRFEGGTPASQLLGIFMPWIKGRRPAWLIRIGLYLYDHLGGRKILPGTKTLNLKSDPTGTPLQDRFEKAFEYSDCWIEDTRLVVLNAKDAKIRGATIMTKCKMMRADRIGDLWHITVKDQITGATSLVQARGLINASGPWVGNVIKQVDNIKSTKGVRLVRGSHIVTRSLYDHDKAYFFQGEDGRIIFTIPYENDFTLIGTTDVDHDDTEREPECTKAEADYLCDFVSGYFKKPVTHDDIVWSYSGVRSLYDDGAKSATAATRDHVLSLDHKEGTAPLLNVFGGKITTYRKLAEEVLTKIDPFFPKATGAWTAGVALPGGNFPVDGVTQLYENLKDSFPFLNDVWARRLIKAYGSEAFIMLGDATKAADLGRDFGGTLTEREIMWLIDHEFAYRAEDIVWRRSRLGLRMSKQDITALDEWMLSSFKNS